MRVKQGANHESVEFKEAERMMAKRFCGGEVDTDQESTGSSSEEMESPRSVAKLVRRWSNSKEKNMGLGMYLHSQILRIRDEDSHIGEDIGEVLNLFTKDDKQHLASVVVFTKPILPASPLGGKAPIKSTRVLNHLTRWQKIISDGS